MIISYQLFFIYLLSFICIHLDIYSTKSVVNELKNIDVRQKRNHTYVVHMLHNSSKAIH